MNSPGWKVPNMLLKMSGEKTPEGMKRLSQSGSNVHCYCVDVSGGESKVRCCKEHYCLGTSSVRSMNQGTLKVVKQEMATMNIDILGISELKWTGMGEFNSDDHFIYYCGQESLRRNGIILTVNKGV